MFLIYSQWINIWVPQKRGNSSFLLLISSNLLYSFPVKTYTTYKTRKTSSPVPKMTIFPMKSSCVIFNNSSHVSKETGSFLGGILAAIVLLCNLKNSNNCWDLSISNETCLRRQFFHTLIFKKWNFSDFVLRR